MYTWLIPKKKIIDTTLLEGMTDVHAHLLPGVDDGAENLMESIEALEQMRRVGVERIFLTSHVGDDYQNTVESLMARYTILKDCSPADIELLPAAEYMIDAGFTDRMKAGLLTLPGRLVLVETSYLSAPENYQNILFDLFLDGYYPLLAHPERYMYMKEEDYLFLKDKGCKFQLNLFSLTGLYGKRPKTIACHLLNEGLYDYVGTDFHRLSDYKHGLKKLQLTGRQFRMMRRLFDNNNSL